MLKERSQSFKVLFVGIDLLSSIISFGIAFAIRYFVQDESFFYIGIIDISNYALLGVTLAITQVAAFISIDLYHPRRGLSILDEFLAIVSGVLLNLLIILSLLFFFRKESFSRLVIIYYTVINIVVTSFIHSVMRGILKNLRKRGYNLRKVIIIGTGKSAIRFAEIIKKHNIYGYKVEGLLRSKSSLPKGVDLKVLGSVKDIEKIIKEHKPDLFVYALNLKEGEYLKSIIEICDFENVDLKIIPDFTEFITAKGRVEDIEGLPIISIRNIPIRLGYNRFIKRTFDFIFSSMFILFFSPFYVLIALLVKLSSKGEIFIRQERVGLDNKKFFMLKFRSMYVQDKQKSDTVWTTKNDPRVTPIGQILRKLSLDETPQFFNVFMGSMSVVGPRPERPFYVEEFKKKHTQYMRRHAVKAGITGWAQINGLRGDTSIEERIEADIFYIENWSLLFDLKIVLLTPLKGMLSKNAY
ncbi:MAG: undecaprenyl-phosphate glucose phosphotransferase [Leptospiraceae bacterium]|nr:undecaprenyl-phosphate glucose phosphotransferase [Leptospiraceae bacterium]MCK6380573.1 undecaprenyl-phosphate glucose phosphotransferase [Leptospiraceae bacterium]NUM40346.1 undecaprenyl-phosphate glucose phosphotransferase [Leptospiraceae bacterium]